MLRIRALINPDVLEKKQLVEGILASESFIMFKNYGKFV